MNGPTKCGSKIRPLFSGSYPNSHRTRRVTCYRCSLGIQRRWLGHGTAHVPRAERHAAIDLEFSRSLCRVSQPRDKKWYRRCARVCVTVGEFGRGRPRVQCNKAPGSTSWGSCNHLRAATSKASTTYIGRAGCVADNAIVEFPLTLAKTRSLAPILPYFNAPLRLSRRRPELVHGERRDRMLTWRVFAYRLGSNSMVVIPSSTFGGTVQREFSTRLPR